MIKHWGLRKERKGLVQPCIHALFQCPECGHDQSDCSVVLRIREYPHGNTVTSLIVILRCGKIHCER